MLVAVGNFYTKDITGGSLGSDDVPQDSRPFWARCRVCR
jgi:hypothetical protein